MTKRRRPAYEAVMKSLRNSDLELRLLVERLKAIGRADQIVNAARQIEMNRAVLEPLRPQMPADSARHRDLEASDQDGQ